MPSVAVTLEDTTLREGEQTPGVVFTGRDKREVAEALGEAGIEYLEVGTPVIGSSEFRTISELAATEGMPTLIGWNRGLRSDLEASFAAGLTAVHIGLPSSRLHVEDKFGRDFQWVIDTAAELIGFARMEGARFISVSAEDMGRADLNFLLEYAEAARQAGATRMRLSDTVGCLRPGQVAEIVSALRGSVDLDLQVHMHNDFGLAQANVLAGVEAGASQVHVTVNGLGDRAGIAALHQVVPALELMLGIPTGIDMTALPRLSTLVTRITGLPVAHNEPVVGRRVFTHESGIHVEGMLKVTSTFAALDPESVGRNHEFTLGKQSGSQALAHVLTEAGVPVDRDQARELLPLIRELAEAMGGTVSPTVAAALARHVLVPDALSPTVEATGSV